MSALRRAVEWLYLDSCDIYNEVEVFDAQTKQTSFVRSVVAAGVACRLSFGSVTAAAQGTEVSKIAQTIKLFLAPEVDVAPGSRIAITRGGVVTEYKASGVPARYSSHQEIMLELAEGYS